MNFYPTSNPPTTEHPRTHSPGTIQTGSGNRQNRWGSLPMSLDLVGTPEFVHRNIPNFRRVPAKSLGLGNNEFFDLVMRDPFQAQEPIPVGLVSNTYRIIQHGEVLDAAIEFVGRVVRWTVDHIHVSMTPNGERFLMRVDFGDAYRTSPDGKDVGLQLVCRNAVDGTAALRAHLGWFRFVCANGLTVGVTLGKVRLPHTARADLSGVFRALESQMESVEADRKSMAEWSRTKVSQDAIRRWVDLDLVAAWRPLAACRVWHICTSGKDAAFMPPFQKVPPSHRRVKLLEPVAGAQQHADNLYAVAQAMSWVASHRCDVEEVDDMQRRIGTLLNVLKLMQR